MSIRIKASEPSAEMTTRQRRTTGRLRPPRTSASRYSAQAFRSAPRRTTRSTGRASGLDKDISESQETSGEEGEISSLMQEDSKKDIESKEKTNEEMHDTNGDKEDVNSENEDPKSGITMEGTSEVTVQESSEEILEGEEKEESKADSLQTELEEEPDLLESEYSKDGEENDGDSKEDGERNEEDDKNDGRIEEDLEDTMEMWEEVGYEMHEEEERGREDDMQTEEQRAEDIFQQAENEIKGVKKDKEVALQGKEKYEGGREGLDKIKAREEETAINSIIERNVSGQHQSTYKNITRTQKHTIEVISSDDDNEMENCTPPPSKRSRQDVSIERIEEARTVNEVANLMEGCEIRLGLRSGLNHTIFSEEVREFCQEFLSGRLVSTSNLKAILATLEWPVSFRLMDPELVRLRLEDHDSTLEAIKENAESDKWNLEASQNTIVVPRCWNEHWTVMVVKIESRHGTITHYDSFLPHTSPCYPCAYVSLKICQARARLGIPVDLKKHSVQCQRQRKSSNDCAIYLARTVELLIKGQTPSERSNEYEGDLRLYFLKKVFIQGLIEKSEWKLQDSISPPRRIPALWMHPRLGLTMFDGKEDTDGTDEMIDSDIENVQLQYQALIRHVQVSDNCTNLLHETAGKAVQGKLLGFPRAYHLLKLALALGAPQYLAKLKSVVTYIRRRPTLNTAIRDNQVFFYRLGKRVSRNELLHSIQLRIVHQFYAGAIEKESREFKAQGRHSDHPVSDAADRVAKRIVTTEEDELEEVKQTILRWRRYGLVWLALGQAFETSAIPILAPTEVELGLNRIKVRAHEYGGLSACVLPIFKDVCIRLRPRLREHAVGLVSFYQLLEGSIKPLPDQRYNIECISRETIEGEKLDSSLLTSLFAFV